jgi:hypothetical protein
MENLNEEGDILSDYQTLYQVSMRRNIGLKYMDRPITKVQELRVALQAFFTTDPKAKLYLH